MHICEIFSNFAHWNLQNYGNTTWIFWSVWYLAGYFFVRLSDCYHRSVRQYPDHDSDAGEGYQDQRSQSVYSQYYYPLSLPVLGRMDFETLRRADRVFRYRRWFYYLSDGAGNDTGHYYFQVQPGGRRVYRAVSLPDVRRSGCVHRAAGYHGGV